MPTEREYYNPKGQSQSNEHWIPWLQQRLVIQDILTQTPELPKPYAPVYTDWLRVLKQFEINEESILIGHSCGGGLLN